jgi:hypothetical protein
LYYSQAQAKKPEEETLEMIQGHCGSYLGSLLQQGG